MMRVSKLTKIGKRWGVILPREVLEEAAIDQTAPVALRVEQGTIVLSPLGDDSSDPFALLRRRLPRRLTDKQVEKTLDHALRRVRHATSTQRRDG